LIRLHLVDGTFELFRAYFGAPRATGPDGREVGAVRGILRILLALLGEDGVSHVACAFDQVIESFRNGLFPGYKTSEGVPADLMAQFPLAERAAHALGAVVWPMVEFEADDALATAAARWAGEPRVEQVLICSPDKDLAQCVRGSRVVCVDRMRRRTLDEPGVVAKFGVGPESMPDWLALVGDTADGIPGVPRWGEKAAAALLAHYRLVDAIPGDEMQWSVAVRGAAGLAKSLREHRREVALYRTLATLRTDVPLPEDMDALRWQGARRAELTDLCRELGDDGLLGRVPRWRAAS
jgi:5'-3' exonuclease